DTGAARVLDPAANRPAGRTVGRAAVAVAAVDIATTAWALACLPAAGNHRMGTFTLSRMDNPGAPFGLGGQRPRLAPLAAALSTVALAV
ncbi:MAG TPA: hypothetical protein VMU66_11240, partial [Gaiellales bacterium]|nr:hypothetical protein [Gaiellales bacterium]